MSASLILASGSASRQKMLKKAGFSFEIIPADINEEAIQEEMNGSGAAEIATELAKQKAEFVSKKNPQGIVIGSDSILVCANKSYSKAENIDAAKQRLRDLSGKTHSIVSAVSIAEKGVQTWAHVESADLTMKNLSDEFIDRYADKADDILTSCVGCYAYEEIGIHLFEKVEGDFYTILGMPLLPLVNELHRRGVSL